jgi:hypothetical protein
VHRWDVESVLGDHAPIPADLAVQEVESVFANFVPRGGQMRWRVARHANSLRKRRWIMPSSNDSLHLAIALDSAGWHPAAWREPAARPGEPLTPKYGLLGLSRPANRYAPAGVA